MFPLILTFNFYLLKGSFWFWGPKGGIFRVGIRFKIVLGSTHIVQQLLFAMFPSILTFDFDLILGRFLLFGNLRGYCWVQCGFQKLF